MSEDNATEIILLQCRSKNAFRLQKELWDFCEKFISDNRLDREKDFNHMPATAVKLMEDVCEIVGYYEAPCIPKGNNDEG